MISDLVESCVLKAGGLGRLWFSPIRLLDCKLVGGVGAWANLVTIGRRL
jgi:hypothetical protein